MPWALSRVNPTTGQILDADIIFDADFVQFWKHEYETFTPESVAALTGGPLDLQSYEQEVGKLPHAAPTQPALPLQPAQRHVASSWPWAPRCSGARHAQIGGPSKTR